jgi:signal transduction histidine kinase/CHASE3 domain sensor protein
VPGQTPSLRRQRRFSIFAGFALALALLAALAAYGYRENGTASRDRRRVAHTLEVLSQALRLEAAGVLMEARHRAWLLTGDAEFVRRRSVAFEEAELEAKALAQLVSDNPPQVARAREALAAATARNAAMQEVVERAATQGMDAARAAFDPYRADSVEAMRTPLATLRAEEERLLSERAAASEASEARRDTVLLGGSTLAAALLVVAGLALLRQVRRAENTGEKFAQLNAEQHAMLDNAAQIVIGLRPDGIVRLFNRSACVALGYTPDEVIGRCTPERFHLPEELAAHAACLSAALGEPIAPGLPALLARARHGGVDRSEWTGVRRDGSRFPMELAMSAVVGQNGEPMGFIGVATDLSARREAEHAIRTLNEELTAQTEDLELTNHELESFSYSVSHDLRAPLRHIAGYARILQEDAAERLDDDGRRQLDIIAGSARRMGALIDDLLALSRLGRRPVQLQAVDMGALVRDALRDVPAAVGKLEVGALPDAQGDPALLKQVWINLLSNAAKYSAPRGAEARITVAGERAGDHLRYSVRDNGVGFDMRYRDKLFGVFQRLHAQDEFEGTGVGLAIVHRIVMRHGGRLDAEGEPGRGAVFSFDLPIQGGAR